MEIKNFNAISYVQLTKIYVQGIAAGYATFQTGAPHWEAWNNSHLNEGSVAEVCIYTDLSQPGKSIGKLLLAELIAQSEKTGIWTLQSSIFPENKASIKTHESCGLQHIGYREKTAWLNGVRRDKIIMEQHSKTVCV
jgi:L-amino acid N-acyltransferase YncA